MDKGILVWSLAAQQQYLKYRAWIPRLRVAQALAAAISVLFLVLFVLACKGRIWPNRLPVAKGVAGSLALGGLVWLALGFFLFPIAVGPTCYEWSTRLWRTPKLTEDYLALISKYHARGIISDSAYAKIIKAMEAPPTRP